MDYASFLGRFHPLLVHLPIGFFILIVAIEVASWFGKVLVNANTLRFMLFWAAVMAALSCGAGYLLSLSGGYDAVLLAKHKWQGIWLMVAAWVAWASRSEMILGKLSWVEILYKPALILGAWFTFSAGHQGGALTHGEDYLTSQTPEPFRGWFGMPPKEEEVTPNSPSKPINLTTALAYNDAVKPILEAKCMACHNAKKSKGDLRMDDVELLKKGGEHGPAIVAGKSTDSDLLKRCLLPLDDDDHMPPKGKTQLTKNEIEVLTWWIDAGASFDKKVIDLSPPEAIKGILTLGAGAMAAVVVGESWPTNVPKPNVEAVEALKKQKVTVAALSKKNPNLLEISMANARDFDDTKMKLLTPINQQIVSLNLANTRVTNASVSVISSLTNLRKLRIDNTKIDANGIKTLTNLPNLESLNLIGTNIDDATLLTLVSTKKLRYLYVWQTSVTQAGIDSLKKQMPQLKIDAGLSEKNVAEFLKLGEKAQLPETPKQQ